MATGAEKDLGRMYLMLGSQEINLADYTKEANDRWLKVTPQDTWSSTLSRVRIARQEALESSLEAIRSSGFTPDRPFPTMPNATVESVMIRARSPR